MSVCRWRKRTHQSYIAPELHNTNITLEEHTLESEIVSGTECQPTSAAKRCRDDVLATKLLLAVLFAVKTLAPKTPFTIHYLPSSIFHLLFRICRFAFAHFTFRFFTACRSSAVFRRVPPSSAELAESALLAKCARLCRVLL